MKYRNLDRTTVAITMLSLMTYALYNVTLIISNMCNPKEEQTGILVETPSTNLAREEENQEICLPQSKNQKTAKATSHGKENFNSYYQLTLN